MMKASHGANSAYCTPSFTAGSGWEVACRSVPGMKRVAPFCLVVRVHATMQRSIRSCPISYLSTVVAGTILKYYASSRWRGWSMSPGPTHRAVLAVI